MLPTTFYGNEKQPLIQAEYSTSGKFQSQPASHRKTNMEHVRPWRFGSDHFPCFSWGDGCRFQPFIFQFFRQPHLQNMRRHRQIGSIKPQTLGVILLMVQKSGMHQLRLVVYTIIYKVLYIPGGYLGFLPSTVVQNL